MVHSLWPTSIAWSNLHCRFLLAHKCCTVRRAPCACNACNDSSNWQWQFIFHWLMFLDSWFKIPWPKLRMACAALHKMTQRLLRVLEDERLAAGGSRSWTPHQFAQYANEMWERRTDIPIFPVPYKGRMWLARFSHNADDVWAVGSSATI